MAFEAANTVGRYYLITDAAALTLPDSDWVIGLWHRPNSVDGETPALVASGAFGANGAFDLWHRQSQDKYNIKITDNGGTGGTTIQNDLVVTESTSVEWHLVIAQRSAAADRIQLIVGKNGTDVTSKDSSFTLTGFTTCNGGDWWIGEDRDVPGSGQFAEFFYSSARSLSTEEMNAMTRGVSALDIMGDDLTLYLPFHDIPTTEEDIIGPHDGAKQGAPTLVEHPPVGGGFYPQYINAPAAAAAAAGGELLQIPHHQRGGFNPMHGGFSA